MKIDYAMLDELGLGPVPIEEKKLMLADIIENLTEKVGARAEAVLGPDKKDEMDKIMAEDPVATQVWLESNIPDYDKIVTEELGKIKDEIRPQVPGILAEFQQS